MCHSYTPPPPGYASMRLFNLAPDVKWAGLDSSGAGSSKISRVHYGLSSKWESFPLGNQSFFVFDDDLSPPAKLLTVDEAPVAPPIGSTEFLLGLQHPVSSSLKLTSLLLPDAPEGGLCKPR
jgi:hypothetical protein